MKPKVLIVEDNPDISELFSACLSIGGMEPMIASSIRQAKWLLLRHTFAAMLVDYKLGDGRGPDLLHAYGVPPVCIMVSGQNATRKEHPGFQDYLTKPVECSRLIDTIKTRLKESVA